MSKAKVAAIRTPKKTNGRLRRNATNGTRGNGANSDENAVRREAELEQIVTQSPFMLTRCTRNLRYRYVSAAYAKMLGRSPEEITGKAIVEVMGEKGLATIRPHIDRVLSGETVSCEAVVPFPRRPHFLHAVYVPDKNSRGEIVGWIASLIDITERKKQEQRLGEQARLLDLSNEAIVVRDREDRVTYWNHGAQELYGYRPEEALGKVTHKLLRTEHPEPLEQIYKKLERGDRWSGELVHKRKDGTIIVVMSHWAIDRDQSGRRAFVLETNSDITARKQAEVALQRSKEMLEKLVQQRTRALRVANSELENEIKRRKGLEGQILEISDREQERLGQELHDGLCQQLTAIGFLTRATALRLKDHRGVQVDDLERIAQLINSSVTDARNIARDLHKEEIDAAEFVSALRRLVHRKIWKTSCRLLLKTEINLENDAVASQLYRILREAIVNANKHARATQILLEVKRFNKDLVFSVTDNGVGFTGKTKGHGLGFHIMKFRAESIGARLELESLKKGGVRVTCSLPIATTKRRR